MRIHSQKKKPFKFGLETSSIRTARKRDGEAGKEAEMMTFQISFIRIDSLTAMSCHDWMLEWKNIGTESYLGQYGGDLDKEHRLAWNMSGNHEEA